MRGHADGHDRTSTAAPAARDWLRPTHWSTPGVWAMSFTPWFSVAIAFVLGVLVAVGARWYVLLAAVLLIPAAVDRVRGAGPPSTSRARL